MNEDMKQQNIAASPKILFAAITMIIVNVAFVIGVIRYWPGWESKWIALWVVFMTGFYPFIGWLSFSAVVGQLIQSENHKHTTGRSEYVDDIILTNLKSPTIHVADSGLVMASIVVSASHWQMFRSNFRRIIGGRIPTLQKTIDWGRKEVIVRLKEKAKTQGWTQLHNVRIETSIIGNVSSGKGLKTELHAYATGARNT